MFKILPLEIIEKILLLLNNESIISLCSACNKRFNMLSDYFWKTICYREDFTLSYKEQVWHDSFSCGMNKRMGNYIKLSHLPLGDLEHACFRILVIKTKKLNQNVYCIFHVEQENEFYLTQEITEKYILFKDEYCMFLRENQVIVLKLNIKENYYQLHKEVPVQRIDSIFGINSKYCAVHRPGAKHIEIFTCDQSTLIEIPPDVKFVTEKVLYDESLIVSVLTFSEGYKIKVYNVMDQAWTVSVYCFNCTGITNDPNIWVGSNFMACCDVSFRLRGIYFGPFKIWDRKGTSLCQLDIEPSNKHYLRCFFKENFIILTTSDTTITVLNSSGQVVKEIKVNTFVDIKLSSGYLLFVLLEGRDVVEVYDWLQGMCLYDIRLNSVCNKTLFSEFLYCPISDPTHTFEVIKFF